MSLRRPSAEMKVKFCCNNLIRLSIPTLIPSPSSFHYRHCHFHRSGACYCPVAGLDSQSGVGKCLLLESLVVQCLVVVVVVVEWLVPIEGWCSHDRSRGCGRSIGCWCGVPMIFLYV
jgi:hypothetical protein